MRRLLGSTCCRHKRCLAGTTRGEGGLLSAELVITRTPGVEYRGERAHGPGSLDQHQRKSASFDDDLKSARPEAPWRGNWPTDQLPETSLSTGVPCCGPGRPWPPPGRRCCAERAPKRSRGPE